jgi:hypothetical protein
MKTIAVVLLFGQAIPRRVEEDGLRLDRLLLGKDHGGILQIEHDPGRSDGSLAGDVPEEGTGEHLRELGAFFQDVLTTPTANPQPCPDEEG